MSIKLNITEHWIEEGSKPKRVMTIEEYLEEQCEICYSSMQVFEISIKDYPETNEYILVCEECAKTLVEEKMQDISFIDTLKITRL